ncbi:UDP-N-acetylmuramate dehydrogenase [Oxalobacter sp. OttesenSCG-928-P03]|nr:UDP-N-acetylmuramate dehydrogenase [Oxalobacter sp. OttesenSCG-928-P03]
MQTSLPVQADFPLRTLNTFGISALAHAYLAVHAADDLFRVCADDRLAALPRLVLGGGSNLLFTRDFPGLVLHMLNTGKRVSGEDASHVYVTGAAGENWHEFVRWTLENGWGGLENLSLIPGTVGAAPVQNIGAYGAELKDYFHSLLAFDFETGKTRLFTAADCCFAYRESFFKQDGAGRFVILEVTFALPGQWQPNLSYPDVAEALSNAGHVVPSPKDISDVIIAIRQRKLPDPALVGNAGSFFKNPTVSRALFDELKVAHPHMPGYVQPDGSVRIAAGWLIDQCGWKGKTHGNAGVCETQALVLINRGEATGEEVVRLSEAIRQDVRDRFGLLLDVEPVFI